jgi:2-methylfumaryl-CoA isomerase
LSVVEGSAFVAAPSGGMTLAQLGADVIRFDQIGGGLDYRRWPITDAGASLYWAGLNKGKRSIALNLRDPEAQQLLSALICREGPDNGLFLTNFPATGWLAYEQLQRGRSDLVMVNVVGNHDGSTAVDYTVNCAVGYPMITGASDDEQPVNNVVPAWDLMCGQMAAVGILAGERKRRTTGEGSFVPLALSDVALAAIGALGHIGEAQINGTQRPRLGNELYGAFGRDFTTADGRRVMAIAISPKQWRSLLAATATTEPVHALANRLGVDFGTDEGARFEARADLFAIFEPWFGSRPLAAIREAFDAHGVCWGPYQSFLELVEDDPRCSAANPLFATVSEPDIGPVLQPASPLGFEAHHAPSPRLGEHSEQILADDLGLSGAEIAALVDRGVVATD